MLQLLLKKNLDPALDTICKKKIGSLSWRSLSVPRYIRFLSWFACTRFVFKGIKDRAFNFSAIIEGPWPQCFWNLKTSAGESKKYYFIYFFVFKNFSGFFFDRNIWMKSMSFFFSRFGLQNLEARVSVAWCLERWTCQQATHVQSQSAECVLFWVFFFI